MKPTQDFAGIDPGAMWEDFKVGMEHFTHWERVAVVTDVEWIKHTVRFFSFLMPGATQSVCNGGCRPGAPMGRRRLKIEKLHK